MKRNLASVAVIACAAFTPNAQAQGDDTNRLQVSGSFRLRYETIDGQARTGFNASDDLLSTRLRILGEYHAGALRFGGELYDSRAFLAEAGTPVGANEINALELVQAYVAADLEAPGHLPIVAQFGRFTLNLGSRRLVAADDYRNTTNGYTGASLNIGRRNGPNLTLIYVLPQIRLPDDAQGIDDQTTAWDRESGDLVLFGGVATAPNVILSSALQASYFGLRENDQGDLATRDRELDTFGLRAFRTPAPGKLDFDVEAFAQTGSVSASTAPNAPALNVGAWFAHAEIGRQLEHAWRPRLAIVADYASGDEPSGDYERFDTLFGMRRAELAPAGLYSAVGRANLASLGVRAEAQPSARLDVFASVRGLWLASETDVFSTSGARDGSGGSGDFAGVQLDSRLRYWIVPDRVRFETNFVFLDKGSFLQQAPNITNDRDTIYTGFDLTFSF
jgi:hypothetical protein